MYYTLNWLVVALLAVLWSLAAWALHGVAVWTASNAGALSGMASGTGAIALPDWLVPWLPPEIAQWAQQLPTTLAPFLDALLQSLPGLTEGLTVVSWVVWGVGSVLLLVLGTGVHLLLMQWRIRHTDRPAGVRW